MLSEYPRSLPRVPAEGRHRGDNWFPLFLFLGTRLGLLAFSYMGMSIIPDLYMGQDQRQEFMRPYPALDGLCRWDCGYFIRIMTEGYTNLESARVFPLYPAISWIVSRVSGWNPIPSLLLAGNAASLGSYFVIYRLFRKLEGPAAARLGLTLFAVYPFAYYQAAGYSEAFLVLASSLAMLLASRRRHLWAGVALGLGVMSRHVTILFGPALFAYQVHQRGLRPRKLLWNVQILGLVIPFVFLAAWSWYLKRHVGDPLAFWNVREVGWGPVVFWSVKEVLETFPFEGHTEYFFYPFIAAIPLLGTIALIAKRRTLNLAVAAVVVSVVVYSTGGIALGRYSSVCWPAFLPWGAMLARNELLQAPAIALSTLLQGLFFWLFSHQWQVL